MEEILCSGFAMLPSPSFSRSGLAVPLAASQRPSSKFPRLLTVPSYEEDPYMNEDAEPDIAGDEDVETESEEF